MNNLFLLHIDLVSPTISEHAIGGGNLFFSRRMRSVGPFQMVRIHQFSAHVTVALVHKEALTMRAHYGVRAGAAILHGFFGRDQLPRAHDPFSNLRLALPKDERTADHNCQQNKYRVSHFVASQPSGSKSNASVSR